MIEHSSRDSIDHGLVDIAIIGGGINGAGIARDAMVADKKEHGIPEIFLFGRCFDEFAITEVRVAERVHLVVAFKTVFPK